MPPKQEYYERMPWLALPYNERDLAKTLGEKYEVSGIPCLVVLDALTGEVVSKEVIYP